MYINPFVAGVLTVIIAELAVFFGYSIYVALKDKK